MLLVCPRVPTLGQYQGLEARIHARWSIIQTKKCYLCRTQIDVRAAHSYRWPSPKKTPFVDSAIRDSTLVYSVHTEHHFQFAVFLPAGIPIVGALNDIRFELVQNMADHNEYSACNWRMPRHFSKGSCRGKTTFGADTGHHGESTRCKYVDPKA